MKVYDHLSTFPLSYKLSIRPIDGKRTTTVLLNVFTDYFNEVMLHKLLTLVSKSVKGLHSIIHIQVQIHLHA